MRCVEIVHHGCVGKGVQGCLDVCECVFELKSKFGSDDTHGSQTSNPSCLLGKSWRTIDASAGATEVREVRSCGQWCDSEAQGADTLNPDLDGESRDWMGESQSQQCGVGLLDRCKAFSMDATHSAVTLCCDAPSSCTNRIRSRWVTRFLCYPLRLDGHWMAGISRAADDSC